MDKKIYMNKTMYLVKWKGFTNVSNSWEYEDVIKPLNLNYLNSHYRKRKLLKIKAIKNRKSKKWKFKATQVHSNLPILFCMNMKSGRKIITMKKLMKKSIIHKVRTMQIALPLIQSLGNKKLNPMIMKESNRIRIKKQFSHNY